MKHRSILSGVITPCPLRETASASCISYCNAAISKLYIHRSINRILVPGECPGLPTTAGREEDILLSHTLRDYRNIRILCRILLPRLGLNKWRESLQSSRSSSCCTYIFACVVSPSSVLLFYSTSMNDYSSSSSSCSSSESEEEGLSLYERSRLKNIQQNREIMKSLGK